jgi:hypothetical protein
VTINGRHCGYVPKKMCAKVAPGEAVVESIQSWVEDSWSVMLRAPRA